MLGNCFCETVLRKHLGKTYSGLRLPQLLQSNIRPLVRRTFGVSEQCMERVVEYLRGEPSIGIRY